MTATINPVQFFENLSKADYSKDFQVQPVGTSNFEVDYQVKEYIPYSIFNSATWFQEVQTDETKLASFKALGGMVAKYAPVLVKDKKFNSSKILTNLSQIGDAAARTIGSSKTGDIKAIFSRASGALKNARTEAEKQFNEGNGLKLEERVNRKDFYTRLSKTGYFSKFNSRFTIRKGESGQSHVWITKKPWFFSKCFGSAVNPDNKIATAENLFSMINGDKDFIRASRFDTQGMMNNLTKIKGHIVRNTSPEQKARIEGAFDQTIHSLKQRGMLINKDKSKDILPRVLGFIFTWAVKAPLNLAVGLTVKPLWNHAVKPAGQRAWNMVKATPGYGWRAINSTVDYLAPGKKSIPTPKQLAPVKVARPVVLSK